MAALAAASDLIARYDVRLIGDLLTDDGGRLSRTDTIAHPHLTTAINASTGRYISAVTVGRRYTRAQLDGTDATNPLDSEAQEYQKDIICSLVMERLLKRRLGAGKNAELHAELAKQNEETIRLLADGHDVFGIDPAQDATLPKTVGLTATEASNRNLLESRMADRYLPSIAQRYPSDRRT